MPNNANDILISLINRAASGIDQAVDFSKAQLPDVIHQLMLWKAVSYSLSICTYLLLLAACAFLIRKGVVLLQRDSNSGPGFALMLVPSVFAVFIFIFLCVRVGYAIQLWLAPKVWLIEYAAELMNPS
ncbi:hypothetical protein [Serratia marcescens]|uniref:Uncharacterized protein n=1 Tax=Serratia marcescens TaxID=615 RepID=A0A9X8VMH5_SERMA|nr:hypothetical protein [Serratia marcescens]MBS3892294.1 hypothetical protein [Serratia marcescens]